MPATLDLIVKQPAGGDLSGRLDVERLGGRVRVNVARLPARFDLVHGPLRWRPEGQHDVTVVARDIQIWRQLNAIQPGHVYAGALDLQASLKGSMVDPDIELAVKGAGLRVRDGHRDWVTACAYAPDGRRLVSASDDGTLCLWDAASGRERAAVQRHADTVTAVQFGPDGQLLSASTDGTVRFERCQACSLPTAGLQAQARAAADLAGPADAAATWAASEVLPDPAGTLTLEQVLGVFRAELTRRGKLASVDAKVAPLDLAMLIVDEFIRYPLSPTAWLPLNVCALPRLVPAHG